METNALDETTKLEKESPYVCSLERSVFGSVSGILFYDFVYPYALLILIQLVLGANYLTIVENHTYLMQIVLTLLTSLTTLVIAIFIAIPKKLVKAYRRIKLDEIKTIFSTLGIMIAFTLGYNLFISLLGVEVGGGNTNQVGIVEYINNVPVLSFIAFVIVGPILEEITYRYFLFGGLRKFNPTMAIIVSGAIFMLVHGVAGFISGGANIFREILLLPPYMFSGCMLAYSYHKTDNLAVSSSIHILNNLLSFILSAL